MRKYVTVDTSELENIDFSKVIETSKNTLRYSIDKSKFLLKFIGDTPEFLEGKTIYTIEEIKIILNSEEWTETNDNE